MFSARALPTSICSPREHFVRPENAFLRPEIAFLAPSAPGKHSFAPRTYFVRPEIEFAESGTIYDALKYEDPVPLSQVIRKTYFHNLDLAPAGLLLSEYETETAYALQHKIDPPFTQRLAIALDEVEADYDLVIIDCPPQLGFTTMTALLASTGLLITVVPSMLDVASMAQFLEMAGETVQTLEEAAGPIDWNFLKFLIARYEPTDVPQSQMAGFLYPSSSIRF